MRNGEMMPEPSSADASVDTETSGAAETSIKFSLDPPQPARPNAITIHTMSFRPRLESRRMTMVIAPVKTDPPAKGKADSAAESASA